MAASKLVPKLGFLVGVILGGDGVFTYWRLAMSLHLVPRVIGNDTHPQVGVPRVWLAEYMYGLSGRKSLWEFSRSTLATNLPNKGKLPV